jgi:phage terminase large subunit GpA-like protein
MNEDYLKTASLFKEMCSDILTPPPDLTVSEWADSFRKLSSEGSAEPGQWRTDRAPYQRGIMDSINDPDVEKVVIMSSAQVGKTEFLLNMVGYHIDYDPAPILLMQPTENLAKSFSKQRLAPMIRDTGAIRSKVADVKTRNGGNTTLEKSFPGGYIALVGANAASQLAGRSIRILLADEVDRFPISAGSEGDPLSLAEKRTNNFYNRKKIFVSTPTIKGSSRIEAEFEGSTQEYFHIPCPSCGHYQPFSWDQITFNHNDLSEPVYHCCHECGAMDTEHEWKKNQLQGKWVATYPDAPYRGFHLNEFVSPWRKWKEIVTDFLDAKRKGDEALKVWMNTSLGQTWEESGEQVDNEILYNRRIEYAADVPDEVMYLTAGVDTQDDRLEIEVVGWGVGKESWGIQYHVIYGNPGKLQTWQDLDDFLNKTWYKDDGTGLIISAACVDSGGHYTTEVYKYCKKRQHRRIYAIKGEGGAGKPIIAGYSRKNREKCLLVRIGVDSGKERIMTNLKLEDRGPGYCHFPSNEDKGYSEQYFKGLTSEKKVLRYTKGQPRYEWHKSSGARNEPLDLRNYAGAALEILSPNLDEPVVTAENKPQDTKKAKKRKRGVISGGI